MITSALLLGTVTAVAFYILYMKMPHRFRKFLLDHPVATEIGATVATYWLHASFGGGLTALATAAFVTLQTSILLSIARDPELSAALTQLIGRIQALKGGAVESLRKLLVAKVNVPA